MKIHRFIGEFDFTKDQIVIDNVEVFNQIKNVLRMKAGNELILEDGKTNEVLAMISEIGKDFIKVEILKKMKNNNELEKETILYCAVLKKENFELIAQKATEIGIKKIVPIVTDKTVKLNLNLERLGKIIREAVEQSGRGIIPEYSEPINFDGALENAKQNDLNLFFTGNASMLEFKKTKAKKIGIFIGPEGGWSEKEEQLAKKNKFKMAGLGKLTLRSETAAIIASFIGSQI